MENLTGKAVLVRYTNGTEEILAEQKPYERMVPLDQEGTEVESITILTPIYAKVD